MEDAGLVVPEPGTSARRGAVALLDFVWQDRAGQLCHYPLEGQLAHAQPGDIIAWLQHPPGKDPAGWRRGHVAVIVAVDDESITTVGWNEGTAPGRVMKRWLWRDHNHIVRVTCTRNGCAGCDGWAEKTVPRSSTVLKRRPGGLYGVARPVAR
jgi:hypothetical protein